MSVQRWEIDSSHSWLQFAVRHLAVGRVRGQLARWSATVLAEGGRFDRATVAVLIDASSIDTGVAERDAHLRSREFLSVERYPDIRFEGAGVRARGRLGLEGALTVRGVTRPLRLDVARSGRATDLFGNERVAFTARGHLDRRDFGLTWNRLLEAGGALVGDRVDVEIDVEAVRQASAA